MAKIENYKYSIDEAFRECFYIIPDYQREYVWTEKEVSQLLEDIDEQLDGGATREYFIGTVLVAPTDTKNHFDVIDGQQRLTTFFLLLCALRHLFAGTAQSAAIEGLMSTTYTTTQGDMKTSLKLEPRYESAGEVMAKIVQLNTIPQDVRDGIHTAGINSFGSLENILNAYETIYRYLQDNYQLLGDLKKYWGYLANNVVFIQISADVNSVLKIFETINERGIGLNPMDLLKNLLFTHVRADEFTQLKDEWKKITKPLEKEKEKPLRFLRYFLMANYKIQGKDAIVREDEIYDWFIDPNNAILCDYRTKPFDFVKKIIRNVDFYLDFSNGRGNDGNGNIAMENLKKLSGGAFSLHYVLLLAASSFPKPLFDHFVVQVESFLFYYIFTKTPTKDLERNFSLWADELRAIGHITDVSQQKKSLNDFIEERFGKNMIAKQGELDDSLRRYGLSSMQKYRTHYLLAKLTQHVDMAFKGIKLHGSLNVYDKVEIEHILPNTPSFLLQTSFQSSSPGKDYSLYKEKLGNLTLLEKPINIVASNNFFADKKSDYEKSSYYITRSLTGLVTVGVNSSINRINAHLSAFTQWTAADIDKRQDILINLAKDIWKITLIS
ncbi:hypothetical protein IAD21_01498 [Abditibacteriota bacterium]|nr:hypothetical protein IAD21_01498 [Abditibacteriota bacterium]